MVDKSRQMDFKGLTLIADEFVGLSSGAITGVTAIATADATTPETTMALANEIKAKVNELIAALS